MKNITVSIIALIILILFMFIQHKYFPRIVSETKYVSDTIWLDTTFISYQRDTLWKPYYIDVSRVDTVNIPVDTNAIIKNYLYIHQKFYSTYFYKDTLQNDSIGLAILNSEITQNRPKKYEYKYFNRSPTLINTTINIHKENEFYIGVGTDKTVGLLFKSKNNYIFEAGYDPFGNNFEIKGYIKLNKLKIW